MASVPVPMTSATTVPVASASGGDLDGRQQKSPGHGEHDDERQGATRAVRETRRPCRSATRQIPRAGGFRSRCRDVAHSRISSVWVSPPSRNRPLAPGTAKALSERPAPAPAFLLPPLQAPREPGNSRSRYHRPRPRGALAPGFEKRESRSGGVERRRRQQLGMALRRLRSHRGRPRSGRPQRRPAVEASTWLRATCAQTQKAGAPCSSRQRLISTTAVSPGARSPRRPEVRTPRSLAASRCRARRRRAGSAGSGERPLEPGIRCGQRAHPSGKAARCRSRCAAASAGAAHPADRIPGWAWSRAR